MLNLHNWTHGVKVAKLKNFCAWVTIPVAESCNWKSCRVQRPYHTYNIRRLTVLSDMATWLVLRAWHPWSVMTVPGFLSVTVRHRSECLISLSLVKENSCKETSFIEEKEHTVSTHSITLESFTGISLKRSDKELTQESFASSKNCTTLEGAPPHPNNLCLLPPLQPPPPQKKSNNT